MGLRRTAACAAVVCSVVIAAACASPNDGSGDSPEAEQASPTQGPEVAQTLYEHDIFPSASQCSPYPIEELPSGAPAGEAMVEEWASESDPAVTYPVSVWGEDRDRVVLVYGFEAIDLHNDRYDSVEDFLWMSGGQHPVPQFEKEGQTRVAVPVGSFGLGMVQIRFMDGKCPYILYLAGSEFDADGDKLWDGYSQSEVESYMRRF